MSEEIDLETNHLCTTEDAFEKFQAVSMYEEDEFITLSDIVSPSRGNHDITEVLNDAPRNNDREHVEIGQEEIISEPIQAPQLLEKTIENTILLQKNIPTKKSRKKKKNDHQNTNIECNFMTSDSIDTKKPLNIDSELNLESIVEEEKDLQISATSSEKLTKPIQNERKDLSIVTQITENQPKRRGRPPKRRNADIQKCEDDENEISNKKITSENDNNISMNASNLATKRGNKKKDPDLTSKTLSDRGVNINSKQNCYSDENETLKNINATFPLEDINITKDTIVDTSDDKNNISEDDTEDIPLVALSTKKNNKVEKITDNVNNLEINTELENKVLSDTISDPSPQQTEPDQFLDKITKKRGRPKKSNINLIHQVPEVKSDLEIKDNEKPTNEEDDISLSKLKDKGSISAITIDAPSVGTDLQENVNNLQNLDNTESNLISKRNSKKPVYSDYEYNIDSIINSDIKKETTDEKSNDSELLLTESARPARRKAKKNLHYDEGSDEDPFANIELSDDEPRRRKKGGRYNSDDEYIPGDNRLQSELTDTDSNIEEEIADEFKIHKKKKFRKSSGSFQKSPKKRIKRSIEDTLESNENVDIELNLETSVIKADENKQSTQAKSWSATNEFENFLAKIVQGTDIKIKKAKSIDNAKAPLQIPTIDPTKEKKSVETSSQTDIIKTKPIAVQTNTLYEVPMKNQVALTTEQSQKAIEFLSGIVKTTSELGQLMTQKSEDFIEKKINTAYVTDTFKMDYCVKKSFLLFKLAKHNLVQMEEDLSKQYEEFLKENNLSQHREQEKVVASTSKGNDSDCEIVEEPIKNKKKEKPVFNPKTVFLNKELSIKIAKKPTEMPKAKEKIVVKGRHAVWINDSVMVKKVKPTQSFLAQDGRNKKPPDTFVTLEMVSDFFKMYERQKALSLCAPYIRHSWLQKETRYVCNYFFDKPTKSCESSYVTPSEEVSSDVSNTVMDSNNTSNSMLTSKLDKTSPDSLLSICIQTLQFLMHFRKTLNSKICPSKDNVHHSKVHSPCNRKYEDNGDVLLKDVNRNDECLKTQKLIHVNSLKTLCYKTIIQLINVPTFSESESGKVRTKFAETNNNYICTKNSDIVNCAKNTTCSFQVKSLSSMCVSVLQNPTRCQNKCKKQIVIYKVKPLKDLVLRKIKRIIYAEFKPDHLSQRETYLKRENNGVKSLLLLCTELISFKLSETYDDKQHVPNYMLHGNQIGTSVVLPLKSISLKKVVSLTKSDNILVLDNDVTLNFTIDNVNTVSEEIFNKNSEENNENELNINNEQYYSDNDFDISYDDGDGDVGDENNETNWVSQVQMQELRSCAEPTNNDDCEKSQNGILEDSVINVKIEPLEDVCGNVIDSSTIKMEPEEVHDNLINYTSLDIITKQEDIVVNSTREPIQRKNSNSYDVDAFESFVSSNKMILSMTNLDSEEIFSQSASRIRRQYEPDSDDDIDTLYDTMNLLVPQSTETAKDRLMASSSDEGTSKRIGKKKTDKRKPRIKKNNKDLVELAKEKSSSKIETLTRRMRGKIRLEEKKNESSDSEIDDELDLNLKKRKNYKISSDTLCKLQENEIQCNDVDSTEHIQYINEHKNEQEKSPIKSVEEIQPSDASLIFANVPIELLQCTPSITTSEDCIEGSKSINENDCKTSDEIEVNGVSYIERHGWKCYPINDRDSKIYRYAYVPLDKLPECFVDTYYRYQNVTGKTQDDTEIDKLTNLQTLHRLQTKGKSKGSKNVSTKNPKTQFLENVQKNNRNDEEFRELSPSEDEDDNVVDNFVLDAPQQSSDNYLAKNLLMDDESDEESKIKKIKEETDDELSPKTRSRRQIRSKGETEEKEKPKSEVLMLTADKMMNTELKLLHAPVEVKHELESTKDIENKTNTRSTNKKMPKSNVTKIRIKDEDASSSEEEKQWVTTKEKLLKRLEKKQETPSVDDAKRAKIVNEYIEKRSDGMETSRQRARPRRRSKKKLLERRKQMKILSRELFGDESSHTGKKYQSQAYSKGRRNIRKVLDKKSLARSTVLANMEEFERKRRLSQRQGQLREVLGCEEGVNVVVINDELCLEYDFENMRPLVTVHQFFTKVMKAHQYEGVKFMWDACFESVSATARGRGGGCILAHCMGLGKTLQVLALLHTVLTHPQLNMRRVLVCCPLSTVLNWVDEINKWIGPVTNNIKVFELSKLKKTYERAYQLEDWYNGGGIFIIGYELFRSLSTLHPSIDCVRPTIVNKIRTALLDPGPDIIICDEGHLLKNDCSVLAVSMSRVVTKRRIVLTGTPMQNNLREYYCMVNFVKPNLLGTYSEYSNRFENPIMNGQHRDSREEDIKLMKARTHILHKVLEGCLQRQEASVLYPYLPKKHEYTLFISLSKCQWDLYKHYLENYAKEAKQSILKDFHILQKIWTHPQVLHNFLTKARSEEKDTKIKVEKIEDDLAHEDLAATEDIKPGATETWWLQYVADTNSLDSLESSNKFLMVFHLLDECTALGDKVLIFSTSLYTMDALEYFLRRKSWSLGKEYYRLDGSVPPEVRQKWCREFNAPANTTTKLFLISTRAGSLGLNMTAANRVIILDTSWNPAHDIQSIFRVYRFGQKKDCYIYRLVAMGTMEQKIYERSVTKQAVACRVVDEQQIDRHYNMSELSELYRVDESGCSVAAGLAAGVRDAALLRVAGARGARALHAVHEHDSLLRGSGETGLPEHERAAAWMQFQQEHSNTHNNIQNIELKIPAKSGDDNDPKSKIEVKPESINPSKQELKSKKNKRSATVTDNMLSQPSTSAQIDPTLNPEVENAMVQQIMDILIKHQYHESKGPKEISELIRKVRKTIANINESGFNNVDPLTASIAKVLIESERENQSLNNARSDIQQIKSIEDIDLALSDSGTISADELQLINKNASDRKRNKQRHDSDEEYVPRGKRKRKKACASDMYISKICNEMSNVNDNSKMLISEVVDDVRNVFTNVNENTNSLTAKVSSILLENKDICESDAVHHNVNNAISDVQQMDSKEELESAPSDSETISTDEISQENKPLSDRKRQKQTQGSNKTYMLRATHKGKKAKACDKYISKTSNKINHSAGNSRSQTLIGIEVQNSMLMRAAKSLPIKKKSDKSAMIKEQTVENECSSDSVTSLKDIENTNDNTNEVSIVLSDDDEPLITPNISIEEAEKNEIKDSPIPLHKSLLTNKNFIKIIAHTYLTGNPKLDEDAALLAAQYSALKALKEVEATGKEIDSGPIYDIAKQVLGMSILERLQNIRGTKQDITDTINKKSTVLVNKTSSASNMAKNEQPKVASVTNIDSETNMNVQKQYKKKINIIKRSKNTKAKPISERTSEAVENSQSESMEDATSSIAIEQVMSLSTAQATPASAEVVPVGMFKGPVSLQASESPLHEECILPDDDLIIITNSPPASSSSDNLVRRNSQQLLITNVSSDATIKQSQNHFIISTVDPTNNAEISTPKTSGTKYLHIIPPSLKVSPLNTPAAVMPLKSEPGNSMDKNPMLSKMLTKSTPVSNESHETICLDSDEDNNVVKEVKSKPRALKSTTKLPYAPAQQKKHEQATTSSQPKKVETKKQISQKSPVEQKESSKIIASANTTNEDVSHQTDPNTLSKLKKASCKPGDIIRISETGKIEILRRTESIPPNVIAAVKHVQPSIEDQNVSQKQQKATDNEKTDSTKTIIKKSQSKGPVDSEDEVPLSVLQNVVHISADQYETQNKAAVTEESSEILRPTPKTYIKKPVKLKYNPSKPVTVPILSSTVKEVGVKNKKNLIKPYSKKEIVLKFPSGNASTSKAQEKVIDLTASIVSTKDKKKQILVKKKDWDKISGTSKDIVLNNAGTLFNLKKCNTSSVDLTNTSCTTTVTVKKSTLSSQKPSTSDSVKRSSTWQDASSKKKPKVETTKKALTLQDFNLDDFDDIIELE
ncbi:unnamed protein product, partial [Brenthis ino]